MNLTSEPRKKWTMKVQYFFMKIHASAWQCIEYHFWTKKKVNFESSIFFMKIHASALKCIESHIWTKKKVNFESSIFFHENSCKCNKMHWISHLNQDKSELWKFNIFSWKFMQVHNNALNLTSEPRKKWTLKVQYFSWKFMQVHDNALNLTHELKKREHWKYNIFSWKFRQVHWISHLN